MELREWLIILGLALVSLIVIDGVRRLQRQRRVPQLDQAVKDLPTAKLEEFDDEAKEAAINWELPNGGARVVKPADYSGLGHKPKLERQDHPGPSKVLSDFRRSSGKSGNKPKSASPQAPVVEATKPEPKAKKAKRVEPTPEPEQAAFDETDQNEQPRREPSVSLDADVPADEASQHTAKPNEPTSPLYASDEMLAEQPKEQADPETAAVKPTEEPILRAEPEDAVYAKHTPDTPKRRQLRTDTAGSHDELDDDEVDEYRLVDFEGIGRSFKRRIIERRKEKVLKKAEKAKRAEAQAKLKAERKALEAEQRREAKEAAEAEKARIAQEKAEAREVAAKEAAANDANAKRDTLETQHEFEASRDASRYNEHDRLGDEYDVHDDYPAQDNVVRTHPTLEKALRHDVNSEHAKETLTNADEMVVISVLSRDPEGFDGGKLLELMMVCGLRYSRAMGVFHRFETESADSELQFSMVNVLKPGTFPIEEMDEFVTPGITFLMPLPGATDSSAAFEAMVETAMVVVRHMGGELKDENRSVMTAQTIEFARQRVHEFERRHRLNRQLQAR